MKNNENQLVIQKINQDIYKKINKAIDIAKQCDVIEILMAVMDYHFRRIRTVENKSDNPSVQDIESFINLDSIKYVIQLIIKFGKQKIPNLNTISAKCFVDARKRYQLLCVSANEISSSNEILGLLELSPDVSLVNDNLVRSDITNITEEMQKFLDYGGRADFLNNIKKEKILSEEDYFDLFLNEYKDYEDFFVESMFTTPQEIVDTYKYLFDETASKIKSVSINFTKDKDGLVYPYDMQNMIQLLPCFCFVYKNILEKFQEKAGFYILTHTIERKDIDVYNLRYYQLSRKPFINFKGLLIVSPEIVLESMFIDSNFSLLEITSTKNEYKAKISNDFLTKISKISGKYGFNEIKRDFDLFSGKRKIGDIDLILKKNDFYLLIEAKNHNLPLDVFFHDLNATKKHLENLQKNWQRHFSERIEYIKDHYSELGIGKNFSYIIVSRFPEILSHFSNIPCFAIEEFEKWMEFGDYKMSFSEFYEKFYNDEKKSSSISDMKAVQERLNHHIWFAKK